MDPTEVYTLRIRKVYFDRIRSGEKTREYRDFKPFYAGLERPGIRYIRFHYQGPEDLLVKVNYIRVVPTPVRLRESSIPFGDRVYEIGLGGIVE